MNRRDAIKLAGALALGACSGDVAAPVCDSARVYLPRPLASRVALRDATQDFMEQLRAGRSAITMPDGLVDLRPLGDVWLDEYLPYNHFSLQGSGGFTGSSQIIGNLGLRHDGSRDWEVRLRGITFEKASLFRADWLQLSILDDVRFQECSFDFGNVNAVELRDVFMIGSHGVIRNGSDIRIRGGTLEQGTLEITGHHTPNSYPGPLLVDDQHMEFATLKINGVRGVRVRGGYRYHSHVDMWGCEKIEINPGEWPFSKATHNGQLIHPAGCA